MFAEGEDMALRVGHIGLQVPNLDRSVAHAEEIMGLREVERTEGVSYLTCSARHHELVLVAGDEVACDHLAFEVASERDFDRLHAAIAQEGVRILSEAPQEPGIAQALRFVGPGGFVFELFFGMVLVQPPDYTTRGVRPRKFEHVNLKVSDKDGMEDFLVRVLGFRLSDRLGDAISWFRCSSEHHGIGLIRAEEDTLHHYAWETTGWESMRELGDHLMRSGKTFLYGPGHHGIGDNYFCYFHDEDGVMVEYSGELLRVENETTYQACTWPDEPLSINRWGAPPPPEFFAAGTSLARLAAQPT